MPMQLYLLSQTFNQGHDTYDSAVVRAFDPAAAKLIHPDGRLTWRSIDPNSDEEKESNFDWLETWAPPSQIRVTFLGYAIHKSPGVVCASFNAG